MSTNEIEASEELSPQASEKSMGTELRELWESLPYRVEVVTAILVWFLVFHFLGNATFGYVDSPSLISWMLGVYNAPNSEDGHGLLIPFVVLALAWMKRERLMAVSKEPWWPGLVMLAGASVLHFVGFVAQQGRLSVIAMFIGPFAIMGQFWGHRWLREIFFPYWLFVFCVPIGSVLIGHTMPLRVLVSVLAVGFAKLVLGLEVIRQGTLIVDPTGGYRYDVAAACSGIRSLMTLFVLAVVYSSLTFKTLWRQLVVSSLAIPLAVLGNVIRLITIIVVANAFGEEAGSMIEQKFGFITFAVAFLGMLGVARLLHEPEQVKAVDGDVSDERAERES